MIIQHMIDVRQVFPRAYIVICSDYVYRVAEDGRTSEGCPYTHLIAQGNSPMDAWEAAAERVKLRLSECTQDN